MYKGLFIVITWESPQRLKLLTFMVHAETPHNPLKPNSKQLFSYAVELGLWCMSQLLIFSKAQSLYLPDSLIFRKTALLRDGLFLSMEHADVRNNPFLRPLECGGAGLVLCREDWWIILSPSIKRAVNPCSAGTPLTVWEKQKCAQSSALKLSPIQTEGLIY